MCVCVYVFEQLVLKAHNDFSGKPPLSPHKWETSIVFKEMNVCVCDNTRMCVCARARESE